MTPEEIQFEVAINAGLCLAWNCKNKAGPTGYCEVHDDDEPRGPVMTPDQSTLPQEIWGLRFPSGLLVPPQDNDETLGFMAWPSREEAERGLAHQQNHWEVEGAEIVRLK